MKTLANQMWLDYTEAKKRFDKTAAQKKDKIKPSDSLTWLKKTETNNTTKLKPLPTKALWQLDMAVKKVGKAKTIEKLKLWLSSSYFWIIKWVNFSR
jgi:hypothetical protein